MSVRTCLSVQVYVRVCVCFTCCGVAPQRGDLGLQGLCCAEVCKEPEPPSSLPCSDMKTISLTADLTTAPQDKCQTRISLPGSKLDDCDRDCI